MTASTTSALDARREKTAAAHAAADQAKAGVTDLDNRLQTTDRMIEEHRQALRNAESEVTRLKRALKNAGKDCDRLAGKRKKAAARAEKAAAKAATAEAKYEKIVLAEMVKREKERDRATARPAAGDSAQASTGDGARPSTDDDTSTSSTTRRGFTRGGR